MKRIHTVYLLKIFFIISMVLALSSCNTRSKKLRHSTPRHAAKQDSSSFLQEAVATSTQPDSGQYCLIQKAYTQAGTNYIDADYIQFLMGTQAATAAKKEGDAEISINENGDTSYTVLDDYYILNENTRIRKLPVANNVIIQFVNYENDKQVPINARFDLLNQHLTDKIFILQLKNDTVIKIKQQFLP